MEKKRYRLKAGVMARVRVTPGGFASCLGHE